MYIYIYPKSSFRMRKEMSFQLRFSHCLSSLRETEGSLNRTYVNLLSTVMWPRRKMMYHTLGTVYALVAILTGTSIVIYSCIPTRRTVFARIRFTVVDIWKREINGGKFTICTRTSVYISEVKFSCEKIKELPTSFLSHCVSSLREAIQGNA